MLKKNDFFIIIILLFVSLILFSLSKININENDLICLVSSENEVIKKINISKEESEKTYEFQNDLGSITILVKDNSVRITSATCSNKICLRSGQTNSRNKPLICIPNHFKIEIKNDFDVVVG